VRAYWAVQGQQGVRRGRARAADNACSNGKERDQTPAAAAPPITIARHEIAVCVKHVPEGHSRLDPASKRLDRSGEGALNHFDANAVEEALRLKGDSDAEVVVVSARAREGGRLAPQGARDGADRAVLVSDDAAAGSDLVATSMVLAKALERESADLVISGSRHRTATAQSSGRPWRNGCTAGPSRRSRS